jgi:hypothetical protein
MQFKGQKCFQRAVSESLWRDWCQATCDQPQKREFAEVWVALMEPLAKGHCTQVRHMAQQTLREAKRDIPGLTEAQIREIISILGRVWYLGTSLRNWAVERSGLL